MRYGMTVLCTIGESTIVDKPEQHQEKQDQKTEKSEQEAAGQLDFDSVAKLIDQIVLDRSDGLRHESVELVTTIIMELFNKELDKLEEQLQKERVDSNP